MKLKIACTALLSLCAVFFLANRESAAEVATVGAPAPQFTVVDAQGVQHSLAQYRGKNVVLEWFNPDCPFVKKFYSKGDMPTFQRQVLAAGDVWLTINSSAQGRQGYIAPEDAQSVQTKLGIASTALLLDPEGVVGRAYGARTTPHLFVIDAQGLLAYAGAIDSTPSTNPEDIAGSSNYVLSAIAALRSGKKVEAAATEPYGCSVKYKG